MSKFEDLYNHLMKEDETLEEGVLDRLRARGAHAKAGLGQIGRNLKNTAKAGIAGAMGDREGMERSGAKLADPRRKASDAALNSLVKSFVRDLVKTGGLDKSEALQLQKGIIKYLDDNYENV